MNYDQFQEATRKVIALEKDGRRLDKQSMLMLVLLVILNAVYFIVGYGFEIQLEAWLSVMYFITATLLAVLYCITAIGSRRRLRQAQKLHDESFAAYVKKVADSSTM